MSDNFIIPKDGFEFPECWSNTLRMRALFAPFRSKSVNPTDWNSKMKFWCDLIESWCKYNKCPVVEIAMMEGSFIRGGAFPVCLEEVFDYLKRAGVLLSTDDFLTSDESWTNWAIKVFVRNPLKWTFNAVKNTIVKDILCKPTFYIHLPVVKYLSEELLEKFSTPPGKICVLDDFVKLGYGSPKHLSIVLNWMQKQGWVAVHHMNNLTLIKVGDRKGRVNFTEIELGIFSLEKQKKLLEENITKLETEWNAALEEAKKHLANKMKNLALSSLRRRRELEKTIQKRTVALEMIKELLHRIDQAKLDAEVIKCYQQGIATLKNVYRVTGLSMETVTGTMDELEELLNSGKDIEDALAKPMESSLEEDLEDELNQLLLKDAPDVPKDKLLPESLKKEEKKEKEDISSQMEAMSL